MELSRLCFPKSSVTESTVAEEAAAAVEGGESIDAVNKGRRRSCSGLQGNLERRCLGEKRMYRAEAVREEAGA